MKRPRCSCGNRRIKGKVHTTLACWTVHPPRPAYPKAGEDAK